MIGLYLKLLILGNSDWNERNVLLVLQLVIYYLAWLFLAVRPLRPLPITVPLSLYFPLRRGFSLRSVQISQRLKLLFRILFNRHFFSRKFSLKDFFRIANPELRLLNLVKGWISAELTQKLIFIRNLKLGFVELRHHFSKGLLQLPLHGYHLWFFLVGLVPLFLVVIGFLQRGLWPFLPWTFDLVIFRLWTFILVTWGWTFVSWDLVFHLGLLRQLFKRAL